MAVTPTIYDWPSSIVPAQQLFYAGGQAQDGGFTAGGALVSNPEAGGRATLQATFGYFGGVNARLVSWLMSRVANGAVFRVPIARSPQIVAAADLGFLATADDTGFAWDNDMPFDNDQNWAFEPLVLAAATALEGEVEVNLDLSAFGTAVQCGHVIGSRSRAYLVEDIAYANDGTAMVTVSPPLRVDVAVSDLFTLRPSMLCTVQDPSQFRGLFQPGGLVQAGSVTMVEALL